MKTTRLLTNIKITATIVTHISVPSRQSSKCLSTVHGICEQSIHIYKAQVSTSRKDSRNEEANVSLHAVPAMRFFHVG